MAEPTLAELTTLRVGGPARRLLTPASQADLIDAVAGCDAAGELVLVLGGGSNLLVADTGFAGTVVATAGVRGIDVADAAGADGRVTVAAGEPWDEVVASFVARGLVGVEALSGIPGLAGATPIQNVGAYGQDVSQTMTSVSVWDRRDRQPRTFSGPDCGFGYRSSVFKREPGRYLVLSVTFQLGRGSESAPIRYGELARRLGVEPGGRAALDAVRETVLELRRGKGMVLDPADHDTWSAGSFFTNPILTAAQAAALPEQAPRFPATDEPVAGGDGQVKTSAAWLIEHAGYPKGYGTPPATLSTRHTLALTNRGGATAADLVALARELRDGVEAAFGIRLVPEPVLVGISLDGE